MTTNSIESGLPSTQFVTIGTIQCPIRSSTNAFVLTKRSAKNKRYRSNLKTRKLAEQTALPNLVIENELPLELLNLCALADLEWTYRPLNMIVNCMPKHSRRTQATRDEKFDVPRIPMQTVSDYLDVASEIFSNPALIEQHGEKLAQVLTQVSADYAISKRPIVKAPVVYLPVGTFNDGYYLRIWGDDYHCETFEGKKWLVSKKAMNRKAHSDNGNGEAQSEIGRDMEQTLAVDTRSDSVLVQAISEVSISESRATFINPGSEKLALRRILLGTFDVPAAAAAGQGIASFDPFITYYNQTLVHNSSLSTFRDVYFDLKITITVQSLPSVAGIIGVFFDRFRSLDGASQVQGFAFPRHRIDLSAKESAEFELTMELPFRTMATVNTPFADFKVGTMELFTETSIISPANVTNPLTLAIYAEPINVRTFNFVARSLANLQTSLRPIGEDLTVNMTARRTVDNVVTPGAIASNYGFLRRTTIAATVAANSVLTSFPVHPCPTDLLAQHPLGQLALGYSWWRGSLKYRFTVNLSKFQNITLVLCFVPADAAFNVNEFEAYAFQTIMFDEKHAQETEVCFSSGSNWLPVFVSAADNSRARFGEIQVILKTPLISTTPYAADPELLIEVAGGHDFDVAHPRDQSKFFAQPPLLQAMNDEVPRTFISPTTNLVADATLWTFYAETTMDANPIAIPVTPTFGNSGALGLLKNTHAAWSGTLEYLFVFVGNGALELRYDPVKRIAANNALTRVANMPATGYCAFVDTKVNPFGVVAVPFCAPYDYLPTRAGGIATTLNHSNCNGMLFMNGTGRVKIYRRAGKDFNVHFYNSIDNFFASGPVQPVPVPERETLLVNPILDATANNLRLQMGLFGVDTENVNETVTVAKTTFHEFNALLPQLTAMILDGRQAMKNTASVASEASTLLQAPLSVLSALQNVAGYTLENIKDFVLTLHKSFGALVKMVIPSSLWNLLCDALENSWSANELALLYGLGIFAATMALGIENPWQVLCLFTLVGATCAPLTTIITTITQKCVGYLSASAVKEDIATPQVSAPAAVFGLVTVLVSTVIPSAKDSVLHKMSNIGKDIAGVWSGAKAFDEMISTVVELVLKLPGAEKLFGSAAKDLALASQVDVDAYVAEVRDLIVSDFMTTALTSAKVAQQERLWTITCKLESLLPSVTKSNFFFNVTLKRVMEEQTKMYKHVQTFKGHARERFAPFIAMFYGETRVGKSVMVAQINRLLAKMMDWDPDTCVYTRQNTDAYFSGLAHQKILYMDDAHTNKVADGRDSDMSTIMTFGSNAAWAPPMASVEDKGRCVNALVGNICTNFFGTPPNPGINNVSAYLARRNMLVEMVRDKPGYEADFSHAKFCLLNPLNGSTKQRLDRLGKVATTEADVYWFDFPTLWKMYSTRFVAHLFHQRALIDARQKATETVEMPPAAELAVLKEMCQNFDEVTHVPITRLPTKYQTANLPSQKAVDDAMAKIPTLTELTKIADTNKMTYVEALKVPETQASLVSATKYSSIFALFGEEAVARAEGDVCYVPEADRFFWKGKNPENFELFSTLAETSLNYDHPENSTTVLQDIALSLVDSPEEEVVDYLDVLSEVDARIVRAFIEHKKKCIGHAIKVCETKGKDIKHWELVKAKEFPRWVKILVLSLSFGGSVYLACKAFKHLTRPKETPIMKNTVIDLRATGVATPELYQKEVAPAVAVPLKPVRPIPTAPLPVLPRPELYQKEVAPAVAIPLKPVKKPSVPVPKTELYQKEVAPAIAVPIKPVKPIPTPPPPPALSNPYQSAPVVPKPPRAIGIPQSAAEREVVKETLSWRTGVIRRGDAWQTAYPIDQHTVWTNRHFLTAAYPALSPGDELELWYEDKEGSSTLVKFNLTDDMLHPVPGVDQVLIKFPTPLRGVKSSWSMIITAAELATLFPYEGMLFARDRKCKITQHALTNVRRQMTGTDTDVFINLDASGDVVNESAVYLDGFMYPAATTAGECGGILTLTGAGSKICGIHTAKFSTGVNAGAGFAQVAYREQLEAALLTRDELYCWRKCDWARPAPAWNKINEPLSLLLANVQSAFEPMIPLENIKLPVVDIVSPKEATRGSMVTSYRASPLNRYFPEPAFRQPAILSPHDPRAPYPYDPRADILSKYSREVHPFPKDILDLVVKGIVREYRTLYNPAPFSEPLSFEQAVNGIPGAPYFDPINLHASPGLPFSLAGYHRKASMFTYNETYPNGAPKYECLVPAVEESFNGILQKASEGYMVPVVYQEFMKDETLKYKKIYEVPATRGIANPPLHLLLAMRALYLPFCAFVQFNRMHVATQVGINPMSAHEWTTLIMRLKANSNLVFDADYTAFDSCIHPTTLDAFADIVNGVLGGSFPTLYARKTMVRYVYDRVSQVTNVQVKIDQGMASGSPITAIGNSEVNKINVAVAWFLLATKHAPELCSYEAFLKYVVLIVYGDDNVISVKAEVAAWFNLRNIAKVLRPFGIIMTDGKKSGGEPEPFSNWDDIRFLKRAFVKDEASHFYLAPLDKKTIIDRIRYVKSKNTIPDLEARIDASLRDAVFHGFEFFSQLYAFITLAQKELFLPVTTFDFDFERRRWLSADAMGTPQMVRRVTYAESRPDGTVNVYHATDTTPPTMIGGQWALRLNGPRPPQGTEGNFINSWQTVRETSSGSSVGSGATVEEIKKLIADANIPLALETTSQKIIDKINALSANTATAGVSLEQLKAELAKLPQVTSIDDLSKKLDGLTTGGSSGGLTQAQLDTSLAKLPSKAEFEKANKDLMDLMNIIKNSASTNADFKKLQEIIEELRKELNTANSTITSSLSRIEGSIGNGSGGLAVLEEGLFLNTTSVHTVDLTGSWCQLHCTSVNAMHTFMGAGFTLYLAAAQLVDGYVLVPVNASMRTSRAASHVDRTWGYLRFKPGNSLIFSITNGDRDPTIGYYTCHGSEETFVIHDDFGRMNSEWSTFPFAWHVPATLTYSAGDFTLTRPDLNPTTRVVLRNHVVTFFWTSPRSARVPNLARFRRIIPRSGP